MKKTSLIFISFLLFSFNCSANEIDFKYGLGFGLPNATDDSEAKFVAIEYQTDFFGHIMKQKVGVGGWFDPHYEYNRTSSNFASYSLGLRVEPGFLYAENYWGVSFISATDSMLSTNFEFTEEIGIGLQDNLGKFIGVEYRHFSNAGINLPNKGRDFVLINTGVKL